MNGTEFGEQISATIKAVFDKKFGAILDRLDALEKRAASADKIPAPTVEITSSPDFDQIMNDLQANLDRAQEKMTATAEDMQAREDRFKAVEGRLDGLDKSLAEMPTPQKGDPPAPEEIAALVREAVAALPPAEKGQDGIGLAAALIDQDGSLVITTTKGDVIRLGKVIGKDGDPGDPGLGFDDMEVTHDGERAITFRWARGETVVERSFTVPCVIDRGVYTAEKAYAQGDGVTYGGSFWIAQDETTDKPDGSKSWRLAVRRGRDGKDGELKAAVEPGPVKVR